MTARLNGRHILAAFITAFGIVAAVNGVFIWAAVTTFSGLAGDDGYRKGLAYNAILTEAAQQNRLGWKAALIVNDKQQLQLALTDASGAPLNGYTIAGLLERPAASQWDQNLAFTPAGPGRYEASLNATGYGSWIATVMVSRPETGVVFRWKERLWLPPKG